MKFGSDDDPVDDGTTIGSNLTGKNDEEDSVYLCNIDDEEGSNLSILPVRKAKGRATTSHCMGTPHIGCIATIKFVNQMPPLQ